MHRALNIAEVVNEIVAHVDRRTLRVLARTAKLFERHVYERLYCSIGGAGLRSLAKRLMHDSGARARDVSSRSRCLSQATYVRSVTLHSSADQDWSEVQSAMTLMRRPFYPLPYLRSLVVDTGSPVLVEVVDLLLCPTLERLALTVDVPSWQTLNAWEGRITGLVDGLPEKAGRLSDLEISVGPECDEMWRVKFEANLANNLASACRLLPLVRLVAHNIPITPKILRDLAEVRSLETIDLAMSCYFSVHLEPSRYVDISGIVSGFRSLRRAHLRGTSILGAVVKSLNRAQLQELSVDIVQWGPYMADLLEAVLSFSRTLEVLEIQEDLDFDGFDPSAYSAYTVPREVFGRLSCCRDIRVFRFAFLCAYNPILELKMDDLAHLARAWSQLGTLEIKCGWDEESPTPVPLTLEALVPFAVHCPRLSSITIHPLSPTLSVKVPPSPLPSQPWRALSVTYPDSFKALSLPTAIAITHYLDALWSDVFLTIDGPLLGERGGETRKIMNRVLDGLRTARAMRPGSRWRMQHAEEACLLSDVDFEESNLPDACPWELIE